MWCILVIARQRGCDRYSIVDSTYQKADFCLVVVMGAADIYIYIYQLWIHPTKELIFGWWFSYAPLICCCNSNDKQ